MEVDLKLADRFEARIFTYGDREQCQTRMRDHLWSIVLAGGEGERTKDFVRARLGEEKPKQYCAFVGKRSLLQHTVDRADRLCPPRHRVLVAASHHREEVMGQLEGRERSTVLLQPRNRGTAAGLFLALTHVLARDPEANVVVFPSDHFVYPEDAFLDAVSASLSLSDEIPHRPVLVGVRPQSPETDYGWVQPGAVLCIGAGAEARSVLRFVEKPPLATARSIVLAGGLWNTSVLVARAERLWQLGWRYAVEMMPAFVEIGNAISHLDAGLLARIYEGMPDVDLSRQLLAPASQHLAVVEADRFLWSDWGRPVRILETLELLAGIVH